MTEAYTMTTARSRLGELVNRARYGHERVILTEHGRPVAAIVAVDELAQMQAAVDAADLAAAAAVKAAGRPGIAHDRVVALMDALDAADDATSEQAQQILAPHADLLGQIDAADRGDITT
jgi:prevent-host-death family protein